MDGIPFQEMSLCVELAISLPDSLEWVGLTVSYKSQNKPQLAGVVSQEDAATILAVLLGLPSTQFSIYSVACGQNQLLTRLAVAKSHQA